MFTRLSCVLLASLTLTLATNVRAQDTKKKTDDGELKALPAYFTAEERAINDAEKARQDKSRGPAPTGTLYCPAEYDPMQGILMRWWEISETEFREMVTAITAGITQDSTDAIAYIVVRNATERSHATTAFTSAGADMSRVEFITVTTDTGWIRDYGPIFTKQDGTRAIIDAMYGSSRPNDDAFPDALSGLWYEPAYDFPLTFSGGNFLPDASGEAHITDITVDDNPAYSEAEIVDIFAEYLGVDLIIHDALPYTIDGTGHIDMWMMIVSEDTVIISQFPSSMPASYPGKLVTEAGVADMQARGYTVYRTPAYNSGSSGYNGTHYTYTNATICNDKVFIPRYGHAGDDATALAVWQAAAPDKTIVQVDVPTIITYAGAMHCLSMHVPAHVDATPTVKVLSPEGGETWTTERDYEITWAASDDVAVTSVDVYYSTDGGLTYPYVLATGAAHTGSLAWTTPAIVSDQCRVKVVAHDADGNQGEDTSDENFTLTDQGPRVIYDFPLDTNPGWSTTGSWAWGTPTGGGGAYGGPDPTSGYTGTRVYGYNLSGDYTASMPERHLTTTALDCSDITQTTLTFWRWLGVEEPQYDHAYIRVSNNGSSWTTIWQNTVTIADTSWQYQEFDISAYADGRPTVYIRWTQGTSDTAWQFCGWNIDDIKILGIQESLLGDINDDGSVDMDDLPLFVDVLLGLDPAHVERADMNQDTTADGLDIQGFIGAL